MKYTLGILAALCLFSAPAIAAESLTCAEIHDVIDAEGTYTFNRIRVAANHVDNCPARSPFDGYNYDYIELSPAYDRAADGMCFYWMCDYIRDRGQ